MESKSERDALWAELTAPSWSIFTKILVLTAEGGSLYDEKNPNRVLLEKAQEVARHESLQRIEERFQQETEGAVLELLAQKYNLGYKSLLTKSLTKKQQDTLGLA